MVVVLLARRTSLFCVINAVSIWDSIFQLWGCYCKVRTLDLVSCYWFRCANYS